MAVEGPDRSDDRQRPDLSHLDSGDLGLATASRHSRRLGDRHAWFFAVLALLLSATGLYGTIAFAVARRTGEIGIRMALGATTGRILTDVLRSSLRIAGAGAPRYR